jgi:predicted alpha-1,2-mannosidase
MVPNPRAEHFFASAAETNRQSDTQEQSMREPSPNDLVNLFMGTAGDHGQLYPGAETPFGFVKLAPDTYPGAVTGSAHAGYDYDDTRLLGFSHLRWSGVGNVGVGGNILMQPTWSPEPGTPEDYHTPLDKASERAAPGCYRVTLGDPPIEAELTASDHVGLHRYTFRGDGIPHVLLDFGRGFTPVRDAHCTPMSDTELTGEITSNQMHEIGWFRLFFCVQFSRPYEDILFEPTHRHAERIYSSGPGGSLVGVARFAKGDEPLLVKVGLSAISVNQARRSMQAEAPDWDFDGVRGRAARAWANTLGRIEVSGGADEHRRLFYTHLYRACHSPFNATSAEGTYLGDDGEVHTAEGFTHYNGWSLWDSYRTKFPLLALIEPVRMRDMMHSLTDTLTRRMDQVPFDAFFNFAGQLPLATIRLEMANAVLLDAHQRGIDTVDPEATYQIMREIALREFPPDLAELGYVPRRPDRTCEYAYDNWAAAEMAKSLGKDEDAAFFEARGRYWQNVWDPSIRFLRARDESGDWLDHPEDPTDVVEKYVYEGSMWHWRWVAVHAVADLVELMGGRENFVKDLEYFFENDLHNHGNEPGIHAPWLFAAAGVPWLSQKWVRTVLTEPMTHRYGTHGFLPEPFKGCAYRNTPDGLIPEMDDDDGCMAGWYVFSSIGLFPVCVGRAIFTIGTPLFEEVVIHNETGANFRIVSKGWARENWYIQSARLNGEALDRPWLHHSEVVAGGTLELTVGPEPGK